MWFLRSPSSAFASGSQNGNSKKKNKKQRRRPSRTVERLENRIALSAVPTIFVDASATSPGSGTQADPFRTIQDAIKMATADPNPNVIGVFGNGNSTASTTPFVWRRDGDANNDAIPDGNMIISGEDLVRFISKTLPRSGDPLAGTTAPLVVKFENNIIDVIGGLRVEGAAGYDASTQAGSASGSPVIFTSYRDDRAGGNSDGTSGFTAQRKDWGGIRFRGTALDQGVTEDTGSLINNAVIRYTGATLPDATLGLNPSTPGQFFNTIYAGVRMEYAGTDPWNRGFSFDESLSVRVRVQNTAFEYGGTAIDTDFWSLEGTGPDLRNLSFVDNSLNGQNISIPAQTATGVAFMPFDSRWDDVGVTYVLTQRLNVRNGGTLSIDAGMVVKVQGQAIDTTGGEIRINGTADQPVLLTSLNNDNAESHSGQQSGYNSRYLNVFRNPFVDVPSGAVSVVGDTNNNGATTTPVPGDWGGLIVSGGSIEHAIITYGGGGVPQPSGVFDNVEPLTIYNNSDSLGPARDFYLGHSEFAFNRGRAQSDNLLLYVVGAFGHGQTTLVDNWIHDNPDSIAIRTTHRQFSDMMHDLGGYGIHVRRNIIDNNYVNGMYAAGINTMRDGYLHGYVDDTDIVHVIGPDVATPTGEVIVARPDQVLQMMSKRKVERETGHDGAYQRSDLGQYRSEIDAFNAFIKRIEEQGALEGTRNATGDNGLFYHKIDFNTNAKGQSIAGVRQDASGNIIGNEWADLGVQFYTRVQNPSNPNEPAIFMPLKVRSNFPAGSTYTYDSRRLEIRDNASIAPQIKIRDNFIIKDLNVEVNISHERASDLRIELISPNKQVVRLVSQRGGDSAVFGNTTFDSNALVPVSGLVNGTFRPEGDLSAFNGMDAWGNWTLRVTDLSTGDTGFLDSWKLHFDSDDLPPGTVPEPVPAGVSYEAADRVFNIVDNKSISPQIKIRDNLIINDVNVEVSITHARSGDLRLELISPNKQVIQLVDANSVNSPASGKTLFDSQAADPISGLVTGTFRPVGDLSAFNGMDIWGNWTLRVTDTSTGNTGTLNSWALHFNTETTLGEGDPDADPITAAGVGNVLSTADTDDGYLEMVFPNQASAVGFWIVDNNVDGSEFVRFYDKNNLLIEEIRLIDLPASPEDGKIFIGRIAQGGATPESVRAIHRVVISEAANDRDGIAIDDLVFVDAGESLVVKFDEDGVIRAGNTSPNGDPTVTPDVREAVGVNSAGQLQQGSTIRILGQSDNPVVLTSLYDNTVGAGAVGYEFNAAQPELSQTVSYVQAQTADGNRQGSLRDREAAAGDWQGIILDRGINTSKIEHVIQNANGTISRLSSDSNPYTIGDDEAYTSPNGNYTRRASIADELTVNPTASSDLRPGVPYVSSQQNLQDGVLIEHVDIRYSTIGIDTRVYPDGKSVIEGVEVAGNNSMAAASPMPLLINSYHNSVRFDTNSGAYRVGGRLGMSGSGVENDVYTDDWFKLPTNLTGSYQQRDAVPIYIEIDPATSGNQDVSIWVFNHQGKLIYGNSPSITTVDPITGDTIYGMSNYLGGVGRGGNQHQNVTIQHGENPYVISTPAGIDQQRRDAAYVVLTTGGRTPAALVPTGAGGALAQNTSSRWTPMNVIEVSDPSADGGVRRVATGFVYDVVGSGGLVDIPANSNFLGTGSRTGAYEMEVRIPEYVSDPGTPTGQLDIHNGPGNFVTRPVDGDIILRQNNISNSSEGGVRLADTVTAGTTGIDVPFQAARYVYDRGASSGQSNAHHLVQGVQLYNNVIINSGNFGVRTVESTSPSEPDRFGEVFYSSPVPGGYHQIINNTIHETDGVGVEINSRSGANVFNNIITSSSTAGVQFNLVNGGSQNRNLIGGLSQPVVDFNIFFDNGPLIGDPQDFNIVGNVNSGGANQHANPRYIDPNAGDLRILLESPAIDAAISDVPDRMQDVRFPPMPTIAPNDDKYGRPRVDNPNRNNTGQGSFQYFDRGAYEALDSTPLPMISIVPVVPAGVLEGNSGTKVMQFQVLLERARSNNVTVNWRTVDGTAVSTSGFGNRDFEAASGRVTFAPGQTSAIIEVTIRGDTIVETDETFTVELLESSNNAQIHPLQSKATGIILNDDGGAPILSIDPAVTVTEPDPGDAAVYAVFPVRLSAPSGQVVTVQYFTPAGGTAGNTDYEAITTPQTLTFNPGETVKEIRVRILPDLIQENDETFFVQIVNSTNAAIDPAKSQSQATIIDNDGPVLSIQPRVEIVEGNRGTPKVQITMSLSQPHDRDVTFTFTTQDGTATLADNDYIPLDRTFTIPAGQTSISPVLRSVGDTIPEPDEIFYVQLSNVTGGVRLGNLRSEVVIINDDAIPTIQVADVQVAEGNGSPGTTTSMVFSVALSQAINYPVTVNYQTVDNTAVSTGQNADYRATSGTLTFAPGQTRQTITVLVNRDTVPENDETFFIDFSNPVHAVLDRTRVVGTILNDDAPPLGKDDTIGNQQGTSGSQTLNSLTLFQATGSGTASSSSAATYDASSSYIADDLIDSQYSVARPSSNSGSGSNATEKLLGQLLAIDSVFGSL